MTINEGTLLPGRPLPQLGGPSVSEPRHTPTAARSAVWRARLALVALLAATAALYLWGLGASGWANDFYSAAVQAGSVSWKAFFYGSSDAANAITVDKPPLSLWIMGLSVRAFGLSSWSILVPQALMGVASVGLLYATVRRWFSEAAALIAGAVLAITPVAVLMFRFNNPDALLVLLLTASAYATVRALEAGRTRWIVLAGALVGLAFLTKMLQALLVVPAIAAAYGVAAPTSLRRRIVQIGAGAAAMVAAGGWWVAVVELVPASMRPYIGGSQHNSVLELIFGYNGFGRLTGNETGSVGGAPAGRGGGMWGPTSWHRLFDAEWGGQVAWLIPAALVALAVGLWITRHAPRTDRLRAALLLWGGWLVVTGLVFSYGQGIIHPYYAVALAPPIGGLVGIGGSVLWRRRDDVRARAVLAGGVLGTAILAWYLLGRSAAWHPQLRPLVLIAGLAAAALLLAVHRPSARMRIAAVAAALVAGLSAPLAYSLQTAATPHGGAIPSAGPAVAGGFGPGRGRPGFAARGGVPGFPGGGPFAARAGAAAQGAFGGVGGPAPGLAGARRGGAGGLLQASRPSAAVIALLRQNGSRYTWAAAAVGSNSAAGYQLASRLPVMAVGGFNGSDPFPSLAAFRSLVASGKIHWFIGGGGLGPATGGSRSSSAIASWVASAFRSRTVGGVTLYDLTAPLG